MTTKRVPRGTPNLSDHASHGEEEEIVVQASLKMSRPRGRIGDGAEIQADQWSFEANYGVRGIVARAEWRRGRARPLLSTFSTGQLCATLFVESVIALLFSAAV